MLDPEDIPEIRQAVQKATLSSQQSLIDLRSHARIIRSNSKTIRPRTTTAISLVASDGGNNRLSFDPFAIQLVRVVDSYGKRLCLDAVTASTNTDSLSDAQFDKNGKPITALGRMMVDLKVNPLKLYELCSSIPSPEDLTKHPEKATDGWIMSYRDLCEWAVLYDLIVNKEFSTDTLLVRDGLLRSKIFSKAYFNTWTSTVTAAIERIKTTSRRNIYVVGVSKHSKMIEKCRLAMLLEESFAPGEPRYAHIPQEVESKLVAWDEYTKRSTGINEITGKSEEINKFVAGNLFFARFGERESDPIWAVDVLINQTSKADEIFGYLLADAQNGFPVPFYPRCLQKAHEHAEVVDLDLDILRNEIAKAISTLIPEPRRHLIDAIELRTDVAARRYS